MKLNISMMRIVLEPLKSTYHHIVQMYFNYRVPSTEMIVYLVLYSFL